MFDSVTGNMVAGLLVGPCALEYTKEALLDEDNRFNGFTISELLQRNQFRSTKSAGNGTRSPNLSLTARRASSLNIDVVNTCKTFVHEHFMSLHESPKSHLLYGKSNIAVCSANSKSSIMGYLSLHQLERGNLRLRWAPNELVHPGHSATESSDTLWDMVFSVDLDIVSCVHCHTIVGPCALEYTKEALLDEDNRFNGFTVSELLQRNQFRSTKSAGNGTRSPNLSRQYARRASSLNIDVVNTCKTFVHEHFMSLHESPKSHLLYGKSNIAVCSANSKSSVMGYLSLHQLERGNLRLRWAPNELVHPGHSATESSDALWDMVFSVDLDIVSCVHCHTIDSPILQRPSRSTASTGETIGLNSRSSTELIAKPNKDGKDTSKWA
ncbi:hypothetical protein D918_05851 [Trichuris suis]|nr:hypothetical protein D918_05851 [Trichuris suis]